MKMMMKKMCVVLSAVSLIPLAACHLNSAPREAIPTDPPPAVTLPSTQSAPTTTSRPTTTVATTQAKVYGIVTAEELNLREKASADSDRIGSLYENDRVEILARSNGFYQVKTSDGETGFVSQEYIQIENGTGTTASEKQAAEPTEAVEEDSEA